LDKGARDPPDPPQPFPVPVRPPASACGARFFISFFTANTGEESPFIHILSATNCRFAW
jgi:hypothetical protein